MVVIMTGPETRWVIDLESRTSLDRLVKLFPNFVFTPVK